MNADRKTLERSPKLSSTTARLSSAGAVKAPRGRPRKDAFGREADQRALVAAATCILREGGTAALTARAVADRVGTAVGSVYAAFPSLEALRLGVNTDTMGRLGDALAAALAQSMGRPLDERLLGLADAYMGFADADSNLWATLFEPRTVQAPPALTERTADLFALLEGALRDAGCAAPDASNLGRALWAAVHGTVFLAGHGSLGPVRPDEAAALVHTLVKMIADGIARQHSIQPTGV